MRRMAIEVVARQQMAFGADDDLLIAIRRSSSSPRDILARRISVHSQLDLGLIRVRSSKRVPQQNDIDEQTCSEDIFANHNLNRRQPQSKTIRPSPDPVRRGPGGRAAPHRAGLFVDIMANPVSRESGTAIANLVQPKAWLGLCFCVALREKRLAASHAKSTRRDASPQNSHST